MPRFKPEQFLYSDNADETLSALESRGKRALVIAGGTGFYELARRGYIPEVKDVVSIMKLGLDYVRTEDGFVRIGSTTNLLTLLESGVGKTPGLEAIDDALGEIRPEQVRNVATVGGELCISVPIVDLPPALLACNASIKVMSQKGPDRAVKLEEFYVDAFLTRLKYGEIVKEVAVPVPAQGTNAVASAFSKIGRTAYDFNLINVAARLGMKDGKVESVSVFLGGVKRVPFRASGFEKKILGREIDEGTIVSAAESSFSKEHLLPSVHGSEEYKRAILPIVVRDCVMKACSRCGG